MRQLLVVGAIYCSRRWWRPGLPNRWFAVAAVVVLAAAAAAVFVECMLAPILWPCFSVVLSKEDYGP